MTSREVDSGSPRELKSRASWQLHQTDTPLPHQLEYFLHEPLYPWHLCGYVGHLHSSTQIRRILLTARKQAGIKLTLRTEAGLASN